MAQQTFQFFNEIGAISQTTTEAKVVSNSGPADTLPVVEMDGNIDSSTVAGGAVMWNGGTYYFVGFTSTGDPIISLTSDGSSAQTFVMSDSNLVGAVVNTTYGGTFLYCFAAGTQISTPNGSRAVEHLDIGDDVTTADGKTVPVTWVGRQTLHKLFSGPHMQPVRIRAGALGDGLPHTDLTVTADHGMVIDGYVINASALVIGDAIDFVPMDELEDSFTVYHIETEAHDVILANGAPSETFIDAAGRAAFDNHQEYLELYGTERIIPEMTMPRITSARIVPGRIRAKLGLSEHTFPFAQVI